MVHFQLFELNWPDFGFKSEPVRFQCGFSAGPRRSSKLLIDSNWIRLEAEQVVASQCSSSATSNALTPLTMIWTQRHWNFLVTNVTNNFKWTNHFFFKNIFLVWQWTWWKHCRNSGRWNKREVPIWRTELWSFMNRCHPLHRRTSATSLYRVDHVSEASR